uniref:Protein-tyrosine sulfotransferase n=1 Tax=Entomoneis paludosa TaxID=265537 RepID=A0A7S2Y2A8_9STRA
MSAPHLWGGFEGGVLLGSTPRAFANQLPFFEWMTHPVTNLHWGLTVTQQQALLEAPCFADLYRRLHASSPLYHAEPHQSSWMVDKTPAYLFDLPRILDQTPGLPVVVTVKSRAAQLYSMQKVVVHQNQQTWTPQHEAYYTQKIMNATQSLQKAQDKYPHRIHVVQMTEFYRNPHSVMQEVFAFLQLSWQPHYLTLQDFNRKGHALGRPTVPAFQKAAANGTVSAPKALVRAV